MNKKDPSINLPFKIGTSPTLGIRGNIATRNIKKIRSLKDVRLY